MKHFCKIHFNFLCKCIKTNTYVQC